MPFKHKNCADNSVTRPSPTEDTAQNETIISIDSPSNGTDGNKMNTIDFKNKTSASQSDPTCRYARDPTAVKGVSKNH